MLRSRNLSCALLALALLLAPNAPLSRAATDPGPATAQDDGEKKKKKSGKKDKGKKGKKKGDNEESDSKKWDVNNPPGEWQTITIDTNETTWSDVDVSPDGTTIVFDMLGDIYTVPIEGGDATALTADIAWNFQPTYSPDGSRIAFISDREGGDNLWVMNADGTEPEAVSKEKENLVHTPAWSPDGAMIATMKGYTSTRSIPAGEIWLFHASGGGGLQLIERPNGAQDQKNISEPAFSDDGRYVFFSQDTTPGVQWEYNKDATGSIFDIRRLDRETGRVETIVSGPGGAIRPTPSPDGKRLAFIKRTPDFTSAIYLKDLDSGLEWPIYDQIDRDLQEASGSSGNTNAFSWMPDGGSIVFWSGGKIRRVDVTTREATEIPVHVVAEKKIAPALRFPVEVAPDEFDVKMLRWAQRSPDGTKAVYQALGRIWVQDIESGERHRLTSGDDDRHEFYPSVSPDGSQVVYVTWNDEELGQLAVAPIGGGNGRVLNEAPGHFIQPKFSPDGSQIVYRKISGGFVLSGRWSMEPGIYTVAASGGEAKRVSRSGDNPQFSADGQRILFSEGVDRTALALKSVDLEGHDERTHLKGAEASEFSVSPDGKWVAFTEQYNAYVAPFVPTGKTVSIGSSTKSIPVKQVSKRSGEFLHWSAASDELHWSHGPTLFSRALTDAFSFLDGSPEKLPEPVEEGLDLSFKTATDRPEGLIALVGARIVTMRDASNTEEVIEDGVVLIDGNRIRAVGPKSEISLPSGTEQINVAGKTIVPGFIDVHAHGPAARSEITPQQNWTQFADLAFGVTTVHDPSNDTSSIFSAAEMQRAGMITAPRIYSTGTILYGANAPGFRAKINSYDDALFHVRRLRDVGAISVKSYQQPRRDQRQQVIAAGRELGVMVVPEGGAKYHHNMNEIVDGHTGIEHAISLVQGYDDVKQLWSQSETGYTPTFVVAYGGISGENYWYDRTNVWENERLMRYTPRFIVEPRSMRRVTAPDVHYNHIRVAEFAKELSDLGVGVQIGAHGQRAGLAAHWEMWMMHQGGFSAWEALRGGTIEGAKYIGLDGDLGSIEVGKLADLVVIDGNPLDDLRRSEFVTYTVQNGRVYDAATMNQILPDAVERGEFFFEQEGGDTIHPATQQWIEKLRETFGWVH